MVSEPDETQQQMQQLNATEAAQVVPRYRTQSDEFANQTPGSKPRATDVATTRPKNTHHTGECLLMLFALRVDNIIDF
jgi:hypothetical protein